ncbi:MAG: DUF1214 domain-containing protein [Alphaproteobacteria bacterium]|nr:DUF1214 domain-containing protein [Alphaproteobacteria bacterium]
MAIVIGLASAYYAVMSLSSEHAISNGPWSTSLATGGSDADMYTRDYIALTGLLALNKDETIYFFADKDTSGAPLDGRCSYRVEGRDPDARWWSITLYGTDNFLIPNPANRYSVSKTNVVRNAEGAWVVRLSTTQEPTNWIATAPAGFQVTLRLYNPGDTVKNDPATAELPSIVKEACT